MEEIFKEINELSVKNSKNRELIQELYKQLHKTNDTLLKIELERKIEFYCQEQVNIGNRIEEIKKDILKRIKQ